MIIHIFYFRHFFTYLEELFYSNTLDKYIYMYILYITYIYKYIYIRRAEGIRTLFQKQSGEREKDSKRKKKKGKEL